MIPYSRQIIEEDDIQAVIDVLRSEWLTTGPMVGAFESAFSEYVNASYAVTVNSGTAALHSAMFALGIGPGDEVIVPAMTFAATANAVVYQGGTPVFADVDQNTLLIDVRSVEEKITKQTRAIIAVDYAGQACDYDKLATLAATHNLMLVADACHSLGGLYKGRKVGSLADLSVFSFHPVKHIAAGEGGMITTNIETLATKVKKFRNHGIVTDHHQRQKSGTWYYQMTDLGFNYRLTDIQCALALSQLKKLPAWLNRRRELASVYDKKFEKLTNLCPLSCKPDVTHAYHLYVIRLASQRLTVGRQEIFNQFREKGIGVNVHYIPVHLHPFYKKNYGGKRGDCPVAEKAYEEILSLPMHAALTDKEQRLVVDAATDILENSTNN